MSPSLPPPPRKLSSSSNTSSSSHRYPKINPNSVAYASVADPSLLDQDDNDDLDHTLANLLGHSHISPQHHPQCRLYNPLNGSSSAGARPLSIASVSSLGSGSYTSYGSNASHSRRVSQALLSPLSPTLSEPHGSYFGTLKEDDECRDTDVSTMTPSNEYDMALAASSMPSCNCCSSARSNSICSSGTTGTGVAAQEDQHKQALFGHHPHRDSISLERLYDCNRLTVLKEHIPSEVRVRLSYHLDECWFLHFAPSGQYMASTGLDHSIVVWKDMVTPEPSVYKAFQFSRTITHVQWSPDSKYLLVNLGFDHGRPGYQTEFNLIDIVAGEIILTRKHQDGPRDVPVNSIGWMTDSERFITATPDGLLYIWNLKGEVVQEVDMGEGKCVDIMCMVPGRNEAVIVTNDNKVELYSFEGKESKPIDTMTERPVGITLSPNGAYLSISTKANMDLCRPAQILIYDFASLTFMRALEADSYINEMFKIMPTFGGPHYEMLCAGSENGKIHFWDVETGELITVLEEHSKHSGCTAFHPTTSGLMASCSDDNHIILWVTKDLCRSLQDEDEKWMESRRIEVKPPPINIKKGW